MRSPTPIQEVIRQRRPFRSAAHEVVVALLRTADVLQRQGAAVVDPLGITLQQYNVLRILRGAGDAGLPTLEVAARMIEQTPGVTRLLDRLEAKDLVRRQRCPQDRRQHLCWITRAGLDVLATLDEPVHRSNLESVKALSQADQQELLRLLALVRAADE
jgi:DNA-binding MarR family transcriptional regulator